MKLSTLHADAHLKLFELFQFFQQLFARWGDFIRARHRCPSSP